MASYFPRTRIFLRFVNDLRLRGEQSTVAIDIDAKNIGFFAQLNWCLYILAYSKQRNLRPAIRLTGPLYGDGRHHDWFHDFFEETAVAKAWMEGANESSQRPIHIRHIEETRFASQYCPTMTIEEAHRLFTTYYRVKDGIRAYVNDFIVKEFDTGGAIGLHFRGTDKRMEAASVDWANCFGAVMKLAADQPTVKQVFVSSDDPLFIEWFARESRGSLTVLVHPDEERSRDGKAVHMNTEGNRYRKGFEAIVNCLLLSRCTALIRSTSFLSAWSCIFNPALPMTLLNQPFAHALWFPDRELVKRSNSRYLA